MNRKPKSIFLSIDWITILLYVILITWGWFSVCGACYDFSNHDLFGWETNSGKQLVWGGTSLVLAALLMLVEKKFFDSTAYFIYALIIFLLFITIFIAPDTKGSHSWIPIGPVKLQPAEFAKFAVALALGKYMSEYNFSMRNTRHFSTLVAIIVVPMLLIIMQRETGSALVYFAFFLMLYREGMTGSLLFTGFATVLYFVVGLRYSDSLMSYLPVSIGEFTVLLLSMIFTTMLSWFYYRDTDDLKLMSAVGLGTTSFMLLFAFFVIPFNICVIMLTVNILFVLYLVGKALYYKLYRYLPIALFCAFSSGFYYMCDTIFDHLEPHQRIRIEVLLGMKDDPRGAGYNVNQAKIAIGSGGLTGKGFLNGTQTKLKYVPEQHTDFIFCTVGEEEGFIGSFGVLVTFLCFIWRLITLAERQPDTLGRVYGYSVVSIFTFHLFINIGMVLGLTPVIGIPLPFFSYGGSSLWGFTILLFIFLRMDAERNVQKVK
ncbi:MAG: rod shape-determining protein RodA [Bacteroidaceae bacterium]|nr:rod shape-determining protein RodA [Bacteroidaceae bacterium]